MVRLLWALPIACVKVVIGVDWELPHMLVIVNHKQCHFNLHEWSGSAKAIGGQSDYFYYYYYSL